MRGVWLSTFSRDAIQILCLSLAGRWWRAEWETGQLNKFALVYVNFKEKNYAGYPSIMIQYKIGQGKQNLIFYSLSNMEFENMFAFL